MGYMSKSLDLELYHYFLQLNEVEKKSVLQLLKTFLKERKQNPERITLEQYNKELNEAEAEYEKGDYISHEEMVKQMKQW